jgi:hypothetical protein
MFYQIADAKIGTYFEIVTDCSIYFKNKLILAL